MDVFRKGARNFRDQVVKHGVLKHIGGRNEFLVDNAGLQRHQQLEALYTSTKASKHFQRDIVRGVEGFIAAGSKQYDVSCKLAEECKKYGTVGPCAQGALAKASFQYNVSRVQLEKEREHMHRLLLSQVAEPLRAMVNGAPLEDARHLTQKYDRVRLETEAQANEVERRRAKEAAGNPDNTTKLQAAESKLSELSSSMEMLGKEARVAMMAVETQQQRITLQRLIAMVETERAYHQKAAQILDQLHVQMLSQQQQSELNSLSGNVSPSEEDAPPPPYEDDDDVLPVSTISPDINSRVSNNSRVSSNSRETNNFRETNNSRETNSRDSDSRDSNSRDSTQKESYFFAEATHAFEGEDEGELSLNVGDYVVVRQESASGWSEGECNGQSGWFPSGYVTRRQKIPGRKS